MVRANPKNFNLTHRTKSEFRGENIIKKIKTEENVGKLLAIESKPIKITYNIYMG